MVNTLLTIAKGGRIRRVVNLDHGKDNEDKQEWRKYRFYGLANYINELVYAKHGWKTNSHNRFYEDVELTLANPEILTEKELDALAELEHNQIDTIKLQKLESRIIRIKKDNQTHNDMGQIVDEFEAKYKPEYCTLDLNMQYWGSDVRVQYWAQRFDPTIPPHHRMAVQMFYRDGIAFSPEYFPTLLSHLRDLVTDAHEYEKGKEVENSLITILEGYIDQLEKNINLEEKNTAYIICNEIAYEQINPHLGLSNYGDTNPYLDENEREISITPSLLFAHDLLNSFYIEAFREDDNLRLCLSCGLWFTEEDITHGSYIERQEWSFVLATCHQHNVETPASYTLLFPDGNKWRLDLTAKEVKKLLTTEFQDEEDEKPYYVTIHSLIRKIPFETIKDRLVKIEPTEFDMEKMFKEISWRMNG